METNAELNYSEHDTDKNAERSPEDGYGQQNHIRGRDPLGSEDYFSPRKPQRSPLSMEGKKRIGLSLIDKKFGEKSSNLISESLKNADDDTENLNMDAGTFLDEKNIIDM